MRYINKQSYPTCCGPVAVLNALKWLGNSVSWRKYEDIFPFLGWQKYCKEDKGCNLHSIHKMLRFFEVNYRYIPHTKHVIIWDIERELDKGNGVILNYRWYNKNGNEGNHYVFIDQHTPTRFRSKNEWLRGGDKGCLKRKYAKRFQRVRKNPKNEQEWRMPNIFVIYK